MHSPRVFISHASEDRAAAVRLCELLETRGIRCWIAPRDVRPGHDWDEEIIDALGATSALVLLLSRHGNSSVHVKHEVERASSKEKAIFTVRLEDVLPSKKVELHVSSRHWLDAWETPLETAADAIARSLGAMGEGESSRAAGADGPGTTASGVGSLDLALVRLGATPFVFQREPLVQEALKHVREGRLPVVLLQGLSGMGKTVLLREVARRLKADFAHFQAFSFDGPAAREPSFFLEEVNELLAALGCGLSAQELRRGAPARILESLLSRVSGQGILFVLDAVDEADPALLSKFAGSLAAAGGRSRCLMAARSRPAEALPAHVVSVGPLQDDEVQNLVGEYARQSGLEVDPAELQARLPPAVRTHPQALTTVLANLHDLPLELLLLGDLPEEARAPAALTEQVVRAVSAAERECLTLLVLLAELDLAAALGLLGLTPPGGFASSVRSLLARSLVARARSGYSAPLVVREALMVVDAAAFSAQAARVGGALATAVSAVRQPQDVRGALPSVCAQVATRLAEGRGWDLIRRFTPAPFLDALNRQGFWKEYCLLLRLGIDAAVALEDGPLAVALRLRLARKSLQTYGLAEGRAALAAVEQAIGLDGRTLEHAELLSHKANFAELDGDPHGALALLDKSRAIRREHGDTAGLALLEKLSGNIHLRLKDRVGARRDYEAALELLSGAPDSRDALEALMGAALCDLEDGRADAAETRLRDALARCRRSGYLAGVPRALHTLALALEGLGRVDEALRTAREAAEAARGLDPALATAAAMLVFRLDGQTAPALNEGGDGQQAGA